MVGDEGSFAAGVEAWRRGLGQVRDVVRQELVVAQVLSHLAPPGDPGVGDGGVREVLDVGCGQGTVALALARAGHRVVGIDVSAELLAVAGDARREQPADVAARLTFVPGDLDHLDDGLWGRFDLVCCHGVLMYLPSLTEGITKLARAVRPGGMLSVLTRNQASLAMRAGMQGDWVSARSSFDARSFRNRIGVGDVRADRPDEVAAAVTRVGATVVASYGVRLFTDHWGNVDLPPDIDAIVAAEAEAGRRDPFRQVAALTHTLAVLTPGGDPGGRTHASARAGRPPAVLDGPGVEVSDPRDLLTGYLAWYRRTIDRKLDGLTETQLHGIVAPLGWSPLGMVQHLEWVERRWMRWGFAAEAVVAWHPDGDDAEWAVPADVPSAAVRASFGAEVDRSAALIAGVPLDRPARVGGRFQTAAEAPTLGRILFHLLQEYARHVGQLDVARQLIDGVTGE